MYLMRELLQFYAALADENRLRLLSLIKDGDICVCHLQDVLETNQPKISRHLAYLKRAGLVESRRDGKWMHYRLKKLDPVLMSILSDTLKRLQKEPEIKRDAERLKKIVCLPEKNRTGVFEQKCNC